MAAGNPLLIKAGVVFLIGSATLIGLACLFQQLRMMERFYSNGTPSRFNASADLKATAVDIQKASKAMMETWGVKRLFGQVNGTKLAIFFGVTAVILVAALLSVVCYHLLKSADELPSLSSSIKKIENQLNSSDYDDDEDEDDGSSDGQSPSPVEFSWAYLMFIVPVVAGVALIASLGIFGCRAMHARNKSIALHNSHGKPKPQPTTTAIITSPQPPPVPIKKVSFEHREAPVDEAARKMEFIKTLIWQQGELPDADINGDLASSMNRGPNDLMIRHYANEGFYVINTAGGNELVRENQLIYYELDDLTAAVDDRNRIILDFRDEVVKQILNYRAKIRICCNIDNRSKLKAKFYEDWEELVDDHYSNGRVVMPYLAPVSRRWEFGVVAEVLDLDSCTFVFQSDMTPDNPAYISTVNLNLLFIYIKGLLERFRRCLLDEASV